LAVSSTMVASASTAGPKGLARAVQGATETCGSCRIRFTLPEFASLYVSSEPFWPVHHTGVATGVPPRLKVVTLMKPSHANAVASVAVGMTLTPLETVVFSRDATEGTGPFIARSTFRLSTANMRAYMIQTTTTGAGRGPDNGLG
jgi:hypothetical protein